MEIEPSTKRSSCPGFDHRPCPKRQCVRPSTAWMLRLSRNHCCRRGADDSESVWAGHLYRAWFLCPNWRSTKMGMSIPDLAVERWCVSQITKQGRPKSCRNLHGSIEVSILRIQLLLINGHFRNLTWRYHYHMFSAYFSGHSGDTPPIWPKIWYEPYLHFRILEFPLIWLLRGGTGSPRVQRDGRCLKKDGHFAVRGAQMQEIDWKPKWELTGIYPKCLMSWRARTMRHIEIL